uniref:Lipoprotein n=1 Tax=Fervidobacterium pennivorans TaxID=93466 RepID=A0A7V4CLR6_FERPE
MRCALFGIVILLLVVVVVATLIVVGCGGGHQDSVSQYPSIESLLDSALGGLQPNISQRGRGDACAWLVTYEGGKAIWIQDKLDVIQTVTVVWQFPDKRWGQQRYYPNPEMPCFVAFSLPYYKQAQYAIAVTNTPGVVDSTWRIDLQGNLIRLWPSGSPDCPPNPPDYPECISSPPSPPEWSE